MKQKTAQRVVWAASITGLAVDIATIVTIGLVWSGRSSSSSFGMGIATAVMIATLALQAGFIVMQAFPNGRAMSPVGAFGPDGWFYVIVSTAIPGVVWHELAKLAIPAMRLVMPGFITPLYVCLVLVVARTVQEHLAARPRSRRETLE